ncbi:MAG: hypothetical protein RJA37_1727 [Verrucomicrobiota bacterium]
MAAIAASSRASSSVTALRALAVSGVVASRRNRALAWAGVNGSRSSESATRRQVTPSTEVSTKYSQGVEPRVGSSFTVPLALRKTSRSIVSVWAKVSVSTLGRPMNHCAPVSPSMQSQAE